MNSIYFISSLLLLFTITNLTSARYRPPDQQQQQQERQHHHHHHELTSENRNINDNFNIQQGSHKQSINTNNNYNNYIESDENEQINKLGIFLESMEDLEHISYLSMRNFNITDESLLQSSWLMGLGNVLLHKQQQHLKASLTQSTSIVDIRQRLSLMLESFISHLRNGHLRRLSMQELESLAGTLEESTGNEFQEEFVSALPVEQLFQTQRLFERAAETQLKSNNNETPSSSPASEQSDKNNNLKRCRYLVSIYKHELVQRQRANPGTSNRQQQANEQTATSSPPTTGNASQQMSEAEFGMTNPVNQENFIIDINRLTKLCVLVVRCNSADELVGLISGTWIGSSNSPLMSPRILADNFSSDKRKRSHLLDDYQQETSSNIDKKYPKNLRDSLSLSLAKLCPLILFQLHEDDGFCTVRRDDRPPMIAVWAFATLFVTIVCFCSLIGLSIIPLLGQTTATSESSSSTSSLSSSSSSSATFSSSSSSSSRTSKRKREKNLLDDHPGRSQSTLRDLRANQQQQQHSHKACLTLFEGLAVGSLVGSALFSLIPQAFELQERESNQGFLLKALIIFCGIYLFFCSERIMRIILDTRQRRKKQKRMINHLSSNSIVVQSTVTVERPTSPALNNRAALSNDTTIPVEDTSKPLTKKRSLIPFFRQASNAARDNIEVGIPLTTNVDPSPVLDKKRSFSKVVNFSRPSQSDHKHQQQQQQEYLSLQYVSAGSAGSSRSSRRGKAENIRRRRRRMQMRKARQQLRKHRLRRIRHQYLPALRTNFGRHDDSDQGQAIGNGEHLAEANSSSSLSSINRHATDGICNNCHHNHLHQADQTNCYAHNDSSQLDESNNYDDMNEDESFRGSKRLSSGALAGIGAVTYWTDQDEHEQQIQQMRAVSEHMNQHRSKIRRMGAEGDANSHSFRRHKHQNQNQNANRRNRQIKLSRAQQQQHPSDASFQMTSNEDLEKGGDRRRRRKISQSNSNSHQHMTNWRGNSSINRRRSIAYGDEDWNGADSLEPIGTNGWDTRELVAQAAAAAAVKQDISTVAWMIVLGDGLHNFIDGISIGAAFSESILSGVSISVAVICEEFPHELGDFAVLVSAGMTVRQALGYNFLSACTCYLGMAVGIILGDVNDGASYISALAAGVFLYIALVDMMGELSATLEETSRDSITRTLKFLLLQNIGIFIGISIIFILSFIDF